MRVGGGDKPVMGMWMLTIFLAVLTAIVWLARAVLAILLARASRPASPGAK